MPQIPLPPLHLRGHLDDVDEVIGARVKELREAADMQQRDVAFQMALSGFQSWAVASVLSKVEGGTRALKFGEAIALAAILGCAPQDFGATVFARNAVGATVGSLAEVPGVGA